MTIQCVICGDPLHRVVDTNLDEWVWVGNDGTRFALDSDLRDLPMEPYAYLTWVAEHCFEGKGKDRKLNLARAQEYASLKIRLDSGAYHEHKAALEDRPKHEGPVPEHCGMPMWLRPSGWYCRQCRKPLREIRNHAKAVTDGNQENLPANARPAGRHGQDA